MNIYQALEEFCSYLSYTKGYSKNTVARTLGVNKMFIRSAQVETFSDITWEKVYGYFENGRKVRGWHGCTFQTYYLTILSFFKWAHKNKYMEETFVERLEIPKWRRRIPKPLQKDEAVRWLKYVRNYPYYQDREFRSKRNHAIYATFLFTGLRREELAKLEFQDIDLENLVLKVRAGKGDKDRLVPLCYAHAQILKEYFDIRKVYKKTCPEIFTSSRKNQGLSGRTLLSIHSRLKEGTDYTCTIHQLRHTFATLMIEGGCDLPSLSKLMGHEHIETTMHYVKASSTHLKSQIIKHPLNYL